MDDVDLISDAARLRAFLAVASAGGFSRAAATLGVTQPTVSSLVAALERRAGARLVTRARAGARLTPAGAALRPHAERILAAAEEGRRAVDATASEGRRHLAVAGGEALVTHLLPPALAALRRRLPRLTLTVRAAEPGVALDALRTGSVDCVLLVADAAPDDVEVRPIAEDRLLLVGATPPPGGPAALRDILAGETLVVREPGRADRAETDALLRRLDVTPAALMVVTGLEAAVRSVEAGLGMAMLPGIAVGRELADARLHAVPSTDPLPVLRYGLAVRRGAPPDPLVPALAGLLAGTP